MINLRPCDDIGMYAIDRSIPESCVHATEFCKVKCYNEKLYKIYPAMRGADVRNEKAWSTVTGDQVAAAIARKTKSTKRVRFMTRGEACRDHGDLARIESILLANPGTTFWMPTRAWRQPLLRVQLMALAARHSNLAMLASIDPTTTADELSSLVADGWSTMFFGESAADYAAYESMLSDLDAKPFKCPKTYGRKRPKSQKKDWSKAPCARCKRGCFKASTAQIHVDLKAH